MVRSETKLYISQFHFFNDAGNLRQNVVMQWYVVIKCVAVVKMECVEKIKLVSLSICNSNVQLASVPFSEENLLCGRFTETTW